ncbi:MAG: glutathione transferase GstA [Rhodospirillales bacterium]|nr:glutathione transferase GstA [Rhodospirillales bacterium]
MKLYYTPGACSLSPHIVLREAGLTFDLEKVDLGTKKTQDGGDYLKINPKGQVPALKLDDGSVLTEGPAIVQYIADKNPGSGLAPANGSIGRYRLQELLNFISTEIHKGFSPLFKPNTPDAYKAIAKENLAARFALVDAQLSGKQYLMGDKFTAADAYLFTVVNWTRFHKIDLAPWPNLKAFMERVKARPKVQEAMKAEGLLK